MGTGWAYLNIGLYEESIEHYDQIISGIDADDGSRVKALAQLYRTVALARKGAYMSNRLIEKRVKFDFEIELFLHLADLQGSCY